MRGYASAAAAAVLCTLLGLAARPHLGLVNVAMLYLLAVVAVALRFGRGPVIATSVACAAAFDFFFVPPRGTFTVDDTQYLLTFAMMVGVGLLVSRLTDSVRRQAKAQADLALRAETERVRSTLLSSISHDLRTPLSVIAGASSSLAEGGERLSGDERRALARSVYEQAREVSGLVDKVLQMTRLESGAIRLERDWASVGEIAASALRRLAPALAGHMVMVDLPDDLPLARVDATLIEQVLANLLDNAARHTPPRTLVRVRAEIAAPSRGEMVVSVEDFGPGLPEGEAERIFDKFQRGARERSGGVGLGLAICRAIVGLHGGRIWAEPLPGGGTALRFTLPLEPAPAVPAEAPAAPS